MKVVRGRFPYISASFVVARRGWVGVGAGVVILVVCEELASVLFCCRCSSDEARGHPFDQSYMSCQ